jgi:hypothetical protein
LAARPQKNLALRCINYNRPNSRRRSMAAFDAFLLFRNLTTVTRRCPFCGGLVEDPVGKSGKFVAHLPRPIPKHQEKKEWGDYVTLLSRA